jgi:sulfide dehydrogenase cytochrome subunit
MRRLTVALALLAMPACIPPAAAANEPPLAALSCAGCHGAAAAPIPAIAGRPAAELEGAMRAFRANERQGTIMGRIARGYTDAEITAIAAFLATQR